LAVPTEGSIIAALHALSMLALKADRDPIVAEFFIPNDLDS